MAQKYRVVHCGTGESGRHGLKAIINHPDLELVGLYVNSPAKVGVDAGTLCGTDLTGILGCSDISLILDLGADCMSYMADGIGRPMECVSDIVQFLERGTNVVSVSLMALTYPPSADPALRDPIEQACARGGTTFYNTGGSPGIMTTVLPIVLLSACDEVESIKMQELYDYRHYENPVILHEVMGFGQEPGFPSFQGIDFAGWWRGQIDLIAERLGITLDDVRFRLEQGVTEAAIESPALNIAAGTIGALRFAVEGFVDGRPVIIHEHVDRMQDGVSPEWDAPLMHNSHAYRVTVKGNPSFQCDWSIDRDDPMQNLAGEQCAVAHATNAIPSVCESKSGLIDFTNLPYYTTRNVTA
jgi:hypothetical protein